MMEEEGRKQGTGETEILGRNNCKAKIQAYPWTWAVDADEHTQIVNYSP